MLIHAIHFVAVFSSYQESAFLAAYPRSHRYPVQMARLCAEKEVCKHAQVDRTPTGNHQEIGNVFIDALFIQVIHCKFSLSIAN